MRIFNIRSVAVALFAFGALAACAENLLENASFEKSNNGQPLEWKWGIGNNAEASCTVDPSVARSGSSSICIKNATPVKPHTYGMLTQSVQVIPNRRYTISCYVKTDKCGRAWIGGGRKWEHRIGFPSKTDGWQRVEGAFNTGGGESRFTLRIAIEDITGGLWIDDVQLEQGGVATPFIYEKPLASGEVRMKLHPFDPGQNLVPNASFEKGGEKSPSGWVWEKRNTDAKLSVMTTDVRSGKSAVKISSTTPFGAHIYSSLRVAKSVKVKPGTSYTISAYIKTGESHSGSWIGGGKGWKVRRSIPATDGKWERLSHTFVTAEDETEFMLRIVTERPTEGLWLDDISLREGVRPVPAVLEGTLKANTVDLYPAEGPDVLYKGRSIDTRWAPQRWPRKSWAFIANEFKAEGVVALADTNGPFEVEALLKAECGELAASCRRAVPANIRTAFITMRADLTDKAPEKVKLLIRLLRNGAEVNRYENSFNLVSAERVRARLHPVKALRDTLAKNVAELEKRGIGAASRVTLTVLDNFIPWVESDIADEEIDRAWDTVVMLEKMADREKARTAAILSGEVDDLAVPCYQTSDLKVSRAQTLGTRRFPDGRTENGPVFFTGYGHFGQVRRDVEKFPGYGCNFLQIEFGPRSVLPNETDYRDNSIKDFLAVCDRAAAADVSVNLLLSPHYFPQWALEKWPHLKDCHGGFFKYCVHDADARAVIERSLRYVIPRIKDHPAIHSLCLSNEPVSVDLRECRVAAKEWPLWLEKRHGSINVLNKRWNTSYASFSEIPVPAPEIKATPEVLDFINYNQETFAAFHRWMADVVHSMAPDMPVHCKIMMGAHFHTCIHGFWCVSPELFAGLSQYNGNDAYNMYNQQHALWNNGWRHNQAGYDFQRSMVDMPVFNSENHFIVDRDCNVIPPEHVYSILWQNAVHGQSSTTLWVWERTNNKTSGLAGSILHRPACVEAVGRCNLDLNRLANEMAAIQNASPTVCLLWSLSSQVLCDEHYHHMNVAYEAANFLGQSLGFVTERKLEEFAHTGKLPRPLDSAKVVILPGVTHLTDRARKGLNLLKSKGIHVVVYGDKPAKNNYNQKRDASSFETIPECEDSEKLFPLLVEASAQWNLPEVLRLVDAEGKPVFGVEIRSASYAGERVASICNHLRKPQKVSIAGSSQSLKELVTGQSLESSFVVKPMQPMMIKSR